MACILRQELCKLHLGLVPKKPGKACWIGDRWSLSEARDLKLGDDIIHKIPTQGHIMVLGSACAAAEGADSSALAHRVGCAWGKFRQHSPLLLCRQVPLRVRIKVLDAIVRATLLWGAQTWALSSGMAIKTSQPQRTMRVRMLRLHKRANEEWNEYWERRGITLNSVMLKHNATCWLMAARVFQHRWAGHLIRMEATSLAKQVTEYNGRRQREARWALLGSKPHSRRKRGRPPVRWSDLLGTHYADWPGTALDRELWKSGEMFFAINSWVVMRGEAGGRQQELQDYGHHIACVREAARLQTSSSSSSSTSSGSSSSSHQVPSLTYSSDSDTSRCARDMRPAPRVFLRHRRNIDPWMEAQPTLGNAGSLNDALLPALLLPSGSSQPT